MDYCILLQMENKSSYYLRARSMQRGSQRPDGSGTHGCGRGGGCRYAGLWSPRSSLLQSREHPWDGPDQLSNAPQAKPSQRNSAMHRWKVLRPPLFFKKLFFF